MCPVQDWSRICPFQDKYLQSRTGPILGYVQSGRCPIQNMSIVESRIGPLQNRYNSRICQVFKDVSSIGLFHARNLLFRIGLSMIGISRYLLKTLNLLTSGWILKPVPNSQYSMGLDHMQVYAIHSGRTFKEILGNNFSLTWVRPEVLSMQSIDQILKWWVRQELFFLSLLATPCISTDRQRVRKCFLLTNSSQSSVLCL